jgi:hypothetical protein
VSPLVDLSPIDSAELMFSVHTRRRRASAPGLCGRQRRCSCGIDMSLTCHRPAIYPFNPPYPLYGSRNVNTLPLPFSREGVRRSDNPRAALILSGGGSVKSFLANVCIGFSYELRSAVATCECSELQRSESALLEGELEPTYAGHSIGHWDGDTLVVDATRLSLIR